VTRDVYKPADAKDIIALRQPLMGLAVGVTYHFFALSTGGPRSGQAGRCEANQRSERDASSCSINCRSERTIVNRLQKQRSQQSLRRDRGPAIALMKLVEIPRKPPSGRAHLE
jgi:hypothetical protein